MHKTLLRVNAN